MLARLFTWWNSTTFGTSLTLFQKGAKLVGKDEQGNRYFVEKGRTGPGGLQRRYVIYHGVAEASRVPAKWHGWLHHTVDEPPSDDDPKPRAWQKPHLPNMTGTPLAYHPKGSLERDHGDGIKPDYEAWSPEN